MKLIPEFALAAQAAVREQRRAMAARSPKLFASIYLTSAFSKPCSSMHTEMFDDLSRLRAKRGSRLAIAAPRGHAKSTIATLAYVLWVLLHKHEMFVVVASSTSDQSAKLLDHVKRQIESNPLLRDDFPELNGVKKVAPWRKDSILLPNGTMFTSVSTSQNIRGIRHGDSRPTLIIADDVEDKNQVISEEQRQKLADWFNSTLLKAGTPDTNVIVVGTVFHHDSLLANLLDPAKSPGWVGKRFQAVVEISRRPDLWEEWGVIYSSQKSYKNLTGEDGANLFVENNASAMLTGRVLWPEEWSYVKLMQTRLREGNAAFQSEFQNDPLDPDQCVFANTKLAFWDDKDGSIEHLMEQVGRDGNFYGACDPSLGGDPSRGDFSAIVLLYKPRKSQTKYVIAADIARRHPAQIVDRILLYARLYRFSNFGVEANQFQQLMVDDLKRRSREQGRSLPVLAIQNRSGKQQRVMSLEVEVSQGMIVFSRRHQQLLDQLRSFPVGKHDDGPDALEMAVHTSNQIVNYCKHEYI